MKFDPGQLVASAVEAFAAPGESPYAYLLRHVAGDWGAYIPTMLLKTKRACGTDSAYFRVTG
jgi:hypothetical protein